MRRIFPLCFLVVSCAFSQQPDLVPVTPDTVIATVNGRKFTVADLEKISRNLTPQARQFAGSQPQAFLEQYALAENLVKEAEKLKLEEKSPLKEKLADSRRQILAQGMVQHHEAELKVPVEEVRKHYESNKSSYHQARVKVIFVSRASYVQNLADNSTKSAKPEEVKAKAEKVLRLAKEGKDFVALAKEYSDDRDSAEKGAMLDMPIRANANTVPQNMRDAVLKAKEGDIVGLLEHETGFYIFKVDKLESPPFEDVKDDIEKELKQVTLQRWVAEQRAKATVVLDNKPFWDTFLSANKALDNASGGGSK